MNKHIPIPNIIGHHLQIENSKNQGYISHIKAPSSFTSNTIFSTNNTVIIIPPIKKPTNNSSINNNINNFDFHNIPIQTDFNKYNNNINNYSNYNDKQSDYYYNNEHLYTSNNFISPRNYNEKKHDINNISSNNYLNCINHNYLNTPIQKVNKNFSQSNFYTNNSTSNINSNQNSKSKESRNINNKIILNENFILLKNQSIKKKGEKRPNININNDYQDAYLNNSNQMTNSSSKNNFKIKDNNNIYSFNKKNRIFFQKIEKENKFKSKCKNSIIFELSDSNKKNIGKSTKKHNSKVKNKNEAISSLKNSFSVKNTNKKVNNADKDSFNGFFKLLDISNIYTNNNNSNNEKIKNNSKKINYKIPNNNIRLYNESVSNEKVDINRKELVQENKPSNIIRLFRNKRCDTYKNKIEIKKDMDIDDKSNLKINLQNENLNNIDFDNSVLEIIDNDNIDENINIKNNLGNYASISHINSLGQKFENKKQIRENKNIFNLKEIAYMNKGIKNNENIIFIDKNQQENKNTKIRNKRAKVKSNSLNSNIINGIIDNNKEKTFNISNNINVFKNFNNTFDKSKIQINSGKKNNKESLIISDRINQSNSPHKKILYIPKGKIDTISKKEILNKSTSTENINLSDVENEDNNEIKINNFINKLKNKYKTAAIRNDKNIDNINISNKNTFMTNKINNNNQEKNKSLEYMKEINYFKCFAYKSNPGKDSFGNRKINQDLYLVKINMNDIIGFNLFGVLDGHGENGHKVSRFSRDFILEEIKKNIQESNIKSLPELYNFLKKDNYSLIKNIYQKIDKELLKQNFNSNLSGCTCIIVFQIGNNLISANVGDSRSILAYTENPDDKKLENIKIFELSKDQKPELPKEKERIYKMGGIVDQMLDGRGKRNGPFRVWAGKQNYPGLAMSRSIGDLKGKNCGLIAEPEIIEYKLDDRCKYMVICSDGVWEFLNNEDVINIGIGYYLNNQIDEYVNELIKTSQYWWTKEDIIMDDITSVVVYF